MLELREVSKSFDGTRVVQETSLCIERARTTVLIGPSGCGKSTLLRIILGLVRPDTGMVQLGDTHVTPSNALGIRQRMGYVIQDGGLFPHRTARGNVTLMAQHMRWPAERIETRLGELSDLTRFPSDGLDRYPIELSGGQRQRVALMRALMLDPEILLLDEPLGALDPMIRADLQQDLREIFRSLKKTVVMVTHDMHEASYFGDCIVLMRTGRIVQQGTSTELVKKPADPFVTAFMQAQHARVSDGNGDAT